MPCDDVTERLELNLDAEDRISSFSLRKDTCGAPVGNALLLNYVRGKTVEELAQGSLLQFVPELYSSRTIDQFLLTKQLTALQACIAAYLGNDAGGPNDLFALNQLEFRDDGTHIDGLVRIDLATEKIKACGNCGAAPRR